jgi:HEAT repeat protein
VPIVSSQARRIQELLARLDSGRAAERDSAVAQLTLLGERAVAPLLGELAASSALFRLGALEVLDRLGDPRALPEVLALAEAPEPEVALRAVSVAGAYPEPRTAKALEKALAAGPPERRRAAAGSLARIHGAGVVEAVEPLLDVLFDEDEDEGLRLAILDDLAGLDPPLDSRALPPVLKRLAASHASALATRAQALLRRSSRGGRARDLLPDLLDRLGDPALGAAEAGTLAPAVARLGAAEVETLQRALQRSRTPLAVRVLADALGAVGTAASIPVLQRALERLGFEGGEPLPEEEAMARAQTKAHLHAALAALDSRIALFDLRHMLAARPPWAVPLLLHAAAAIGDGSLVPALTRLSSERPEHLEACAKTFAAIARRERLRRTSAALRAVRTEDRSVLDAFWEKARGEKRASRARR